MVVGATSLKAATSSSDSQAEAESSSDVESEEKIIRQSLGFRKIETQKESEE
jgi:hypothetical protein